MDLQVASIGTIETKTGFLVPPMVINVPSWDDLTAKTITLAIYSEAGTLLFVLTDEEDQIDVTPAQLVVSPEASPIDSETASASQARYATWGEMPPSSAPYKAVLSITGSAQNDAEIGLAFDLRHRAAHDTNAVATSLMATVTVTDSEDLVVNVAINPPAGGAGAVAPPLGLAVSDETTDLTPGTAKATFRMPHAMTLSEVRASTTTAPVGSALIIDINKNGASILSTKLSIDAGEKTSVAAAVPAVIADPALGDDDEITVDIDQVGATVPGAGLKIWLLGTYA